MHPSEESFDTDARSPRGVSVLCVDDSEDMQAIMTDFLEAEGYDVTVAGNAHAALRLLRSGQFRLLVTDQVLPDETGTWLLEQAQAQGLLRKIGAVVVTANSYPEEIARPAGIPVFQKPVPLDHFLATLGDMLESRRREAREVAARR